MTILDLLGEPEWSIVLPMPLSVNQLSIPVATRGRSRFVTSPDHRVWKTAVSFLSWRESCFIDRKFLVLRVFPGPDMSDKSDVDNLLKSPIDALVSNGVLIDDSKKHVVGCMAFWAGDHPVGKGIAQMDVYPEKILNGKEPDKGLFDEGHVQ